MADQSKQEMLDAGLIIPKEEIIEDVEITFEADEDNKEFIDIVPKEELPSSSPHGDYDQSVMPIKTELTLSKEIGQIRSQQKTLGPGESSIYIEVKVEPQEEASAPPAEPSCSASTPKKRTRSRRARGDTKTHSATCNVCEKTFKNQSSLVVHMRTHTDAPLLVERTQKRHGPEKHYSCTVCSYRCQDKSVLVAHARAHIGVKPYKCTKCELKFTSKAVLKYHTMLHAGVKPHSCQLCDAKYVHKASLSYHMRVHTGEKPHACNICEARFTRENQLKSHMSVHAANSCHACNICKGKFANESQLLAHMEVHTGNKAVACDVCQVEFASKQDLITHRRVHTSEIKKINSNLPESASALFACNICDSKFEQLGFLSEHVRRHRRSQRLPIGPALENSYSGS